MRIVNDTILDLSAVVASVNSEAVHLDFLYGFSVQLAFTSTTASAVIRLQCSNDEATWINIAGTDQTVNNNNDTVMLNVADAFYKFMRVQVVYTSGSITTINAIINAKGI